MRNLKKVGVLLLICAISVLSPLTVFAGQWKQDNVGWWYQNNDASYPKSQWQQIDGKWYYFGENGYMHTGWNKIDNKWYCLKSDGAMQTGWLTDNGKWYYLHSDGSMAYGTTIEGYKLGNDGAWIEEKAVNIVIPQAKGYGSINGNISYKYNNYIGHRGDTGAKVLLIPLDYYIKGGDNSSLSFLMNTNGKNGVQFTKVDGLGQYKISNVPTGNYLLVIVSENTTASTRFLDEASWKNEIEHYMKDFLTDEELTTFELFLGFQKYYFSKIIINENQENVISYDFGITFK